MLKENVLLLVGAYNKVWTEAANNEPGLWKDYIKHVDKKVSPGLLKLSFSSKTSLSSYLTSSINSCSDLSNLIDIFAKNHKAIIRVCKQISLIVLVAINKNYVYEDSEFETAQTRHQADMKEELLKSYAVISDNLSSSANLFAVCKLILYFDLI